MKHAWFSQKQFDNRIDINNNAKGIDNCELNWVYYKLKNGNIVLTSEITSSEKYNSRFDDAIYLGVVEEFYGAFKEELTK
tara:strand:+ start:740 stop:979 length:240 start_codon:yes stop_codon:yes gene_type:complete